MPVKREFDHCAQDYARYRPGYPREVLAALAAEAGQPDGRRAADVGAGTGIFSRCLAAAGWQVTAVEPSEAMLRHVNQDQGAAGGPTIQPVCATAEEISLADASVVLLTAVQAFHWFNPPYALAEFARVLRAGGLLALIWNNRDAERCAFVAEFERLVGRYNPGYRREYRQQDWAAKIAAARAFGPAAHRAYGQEWTAPQEAFVGFCRSVSYIRNVLSREEMPRFEDDLRRLMGLHFGDGDCIIPLRTDTWTARRL